MSLRRSARNVKVAAPGPSEALYQKADVKGSSSKTSTTLAIPTPPGQVQDGVHARKKATTTASARALSKPGTSKQASSRKRKSAPEQSASIPANVTKPSETVVSTGAPDLLEQTPPTVLQSTDITNPAEKFPIPNGADSLPATQSLTDPDAPSTPLPSKRQRRTKAPSVSPAKPIPFTPTPSGVGLIAGTANVRRPTAADHMLDDLASLNRPAAPHATNAPLLTPNGTSIVVADGESPSKKRRAAKELPPDVGSPAKSRTSTIDSLLSDAEAFLVRVDAELVGNGRLEKLVRTHKCKMFSPEGLREVVDPFTALASGIIGQQVSGAAAASIRKKFTALFTDTHPAFPTPAQVLTFDIPTLRTAGLSQRKAEYITGLAEKFASGEFTAEGLVSAGDEELIEKLITVRGLGRWSVEMFACFGLKRMDVFSTGDLGVQRGMAAYMGRDVSKLKNKGGKWKYMSEQEMLSIASKFSPYRSLFMWYMWRIADVDTEVLE